MQIKYITRVICKHVIFYHFNNFDIKARSSKSPNYSSLFASKATCLLSELTLILTAYHISTKFYMHIHNSLNIIIIITTVKPLNSGHLRVWSKLPAIRRRPLFGGLVKIFNF